MRKVKQGRVMQKFRWYNMHEEVLRKLTGTYLHPRKSLCLGGNSGCPWPKDGGSHLEAKGNCASSPPVCLSPNPREKSLHGTVRVASPWTRPETCLETMGWDSQYPWMGEFSYPSFHFKHWNASPLKSMGPFGQEQQLQELRESWPNAVLDVAPTGGGTFVDLLVKS